MPDLLFYAGGECFERYGTLIRRLDPRHGGYTHSRSGSLAAYTGRDGTLLNAEANVPRISWLDLDEDGEFETPAYVGGPTRVNLVTDQDIQSGTGWADSSGTPVVTPNQSDPAGGTDAFTVEDDSVGSTEDRTYTLPALISGAGSRSAVFVVRENTMPASGNQRIFIVSYLDGTVAAFNITGWTAGKPSVSAFGSGTVLGMWYVGDGFWAIAVQTDSISDAAQLTLTIRPAVTAAETGSIDVYLLHVYDEDRPHSSLIPGATTLNADLLSARWPFPQRQMTLYLRMMEAGDAYSGLETPAFIHIGSTGSQTPLLVVQSPAGQDGRYRLSYNNGTANVTLMTDSGTLGAVGGEVEIRAVIDVNADGDADLLTGITIGGAAGGAAEVTTEAAGPSGGLPDGEPYAGELIYFCSDGATTGHAVNPLIAAKLALGVHGRDAMRAAG